MLSNSRIKGWIERNKYIIINEFKLKMAMNIGFEKYIGRSHGRLYFLIITPSYRILIKDKPYLGHQSKTLTAIPEPNWYEIKDYDWIKNLKNAVKS